MFRFVILLLSRTVLFDLLDLDHDGLIHRSELSTFITIALHAQGIQQTNSQIGMFTDGRFQHLVLHVSAPFSPCNGTLSHSVSLAR